MRKRQLRRRWMLYLAFTCLLIPPAEAASPPLLEILLEALPSEEDRAWFRETADFDEIYAELRQAALKLLELFPPENFTYVSVGRSGTPVIAFLQQAGIHGAHNVPLTGAAYAFNPQSAVRFRRRLDRYFREIFRQAKVENGKSILLLDYANTGLSLTAFRLKFTEQLRKAGYSNEVASLALYGGWSQPFFPPNSSFRYVKLGRWLDLMTFLEDFKEWAEYEPYFLVDPEDGPRPPRPLSSLRRRPQYQVLSLWLRLMQENDATLARVLGPLPPPACPEAFTRLVKR